MIRRKSMSFLQSMMDDMKQEQYRVNDYSIAVGKKR